MTPPNTSKYLRYDENVTVSINGIKYDVPTTFSEVSLNQYLRDHLHLPGTKVTCREGGCGVCIVHVVCSDPLRKEVTIQKSINSCLCPILSCDGWEITTIEHIGTQYQPHPIQSAMTDHYATQCGYCTPGWVMNMYSLLQNNPLSTLSEQQVEDACDGNICRCTGYRPILDALKSFASGHQSRVSVPDLEDMGSSKCQKTDKSCHGSWHNKRNPYVKALTAAVETTAPPWYKPTTINDLYALLQKWSGFKVYYVCGHTGVGVYNDEPSDAYVDLKGISTLYEIIHPGPATNTLTVGSNCTLTELIQVFNEQSRTPGFGHLASLASLISKTAHHSVRNMGSWAGNLAMKNMHKEFPSDSFIAFAITRATITVGPGERRYSMEDFLTLDLQGKIILRAEFPAYGQDYIFRTFKIMPRFGNAHAYVSAAFRARVDKTTSLEKIVVSDVGLIFGNISRELVHAQATEALLEGQDIADHGVLSAALAALGTEIQPAEEASEASAAYKRNLTLVLFYKFALELVGEQADMRYRSAVGSLVRPLSSGTQTFQTKSENYPLTKAIPKIESMVQCTGEAKYTSDIDEEGMLHGEFVLTTQANAMVYSIDTTEALALPGVIRVLTAEDIPGSNNIGRLDNIMELFATKQSLYAGQPIGLVVADAIARKAAKLVKIEYFNVRKPLLTCQDAIAAQSFFKGPPNLVVGDAEAAIAGAPHKIEGQIELGTQNHFYMETEVSVTYPTEDGLDIRCGTQFIDIVQEHVALCCGIGKNQVNITVKRSGGGFGGKGGQNWVYAASAVAAYLLRRPVKVHLTLWDNLKMKGRRFPYYTTYRVGTDADGKLVGIILDIYGNIGASDVDIATLFFAGEGSDNAYFCPAWKVSMYGCKTDIPPNRFCRAPGSTEGLFFIEHIMEHLAKSLNKSSIEIKQLNFYKNGDTMLSGSIIKDCIMPAILDQLLASSDFESRSKSITAFNKANRWRKRGISVVPMRFPCEWTRGNYTCLIAVFHGGGTIAITHGGIEMGQGINTKVAQVVASELDVDMSYIAIQPVQAITNANAKGTDSSITSELVCLAALDCCRQLKNRIDPFREKDKGRLWKDVIEDCYENGIDLSARAWTNPKPIQHVVYNTYGAMCTEVEVDVLTGEFQISRLDVLYDCGESMSPFIDIGQVEGAIVMGLGYYTMEDQIYDPKTGENLTYSTWKYKPPMAKDIPVDFRVELLKNAPNPSGILRSKLVGEPPLCMTASVVFALREAIAANLADAGKSDLWSSVVTPMTVERIQINSQISVSDLKYND